MVSYGLNGKVNVDRQKLRDAIKNDLIEHKQFTSAEARDFKSDLEGVLPEAQIDEIIVRLRRVSDHVSGPVSKMETLGGLVRLHKI